MYHLLLFIIIIIILKSIDISNDSSNYLLMYSCIYVFIDMLSSTLFHLIIFNSYPLALPCLPSNINIMNMTHVIRLFITYLLHQYHVCNICYSTIHHLFVTYLLCKSVNYNIWASYRIKWVSHQAQPRGNSEWYIVYCIFPLLLLFSFSFTFSSQLNLAISSSPSLLFALMISKIISCIFTSFVAQITHLVLFWLILPS